MIKNSSAAIDRDLCHIRDRSRNVPTQKVGYESMSDFLHGFANDPKNPFGDVNSLNVFYIRHP